MNEFLTSWIFTSRNCNANEELQYKIIKSTGIPTLTRCELFRMPQIMYDFFSSFFYLILARQYGPEREREK